MEKVVAETEELPKAIVRRVVKEKLSDCSPDYDFNVHKDALLAFTESARIFIHYLSATANDICKESKRQTMNAEDVLKALEEVEFSEFVKPLRASLNEFRKKNAAKKGGAVKESEVKKKRKIEDSSARNGTKSKRKKMDSDKQEQEEKEVEEHEEDEEQEEKEVEEHEEDEEKEVEEQEEDEEQEEKEVEEQEDDEEHEEDNRGSE